MNINDFVSTGAAAKYLASNSNSQSTTGVNAAAPAGLLKAEKRIQAQVDTTSTQLSSFGKLKSSVSSAQIAARALGSLTSTASSAAEKTAANAFVSAFNSATNTAKTAAAVPGETAATSNSATRVSKDLLRTVGADAATIDALKKVGFSVNTDGNLVLDAKKFDAAQKADPTGVRATLTKLGQQVDKTATKELATDGNVGNSLSSLNQRATVLKSQQSALMSLGQTTSSTQSSSSTGAFSFGLSAYQSS
jgi:hypothetical protein